MNEMEKLDILIKRLDEQRDAYLETNHLVRELLIAASPTSQAPPAPLESLESPATPVRDTPRSPGGSQTTFLPTWRKQSAGLDSVITSSASRATTGEGSDDEEGGEEYYVQTPLEQQQYDHEGLRHHLRSFKWTDAARTLLNGVVDDAAFMRKPTLFPTKKGPAPDRSHFSHHQVFDVGADGAPLPVELPESERPPSNALVIWNTIKDVNMS